MFGSFENKTALRFIFAKPFFPYGDIQSTQDVPFHQNHVNYSGKNQR
jgi:hypothetical protein